MSTKVKAFAINTLKIGALNVLASTEGKPVVVELEEGVFKELVQLNAVRKATDEEIQASELRAGTSGQVTEDLEKKPSKKEVDAAAKAAKAAVKAPSSGAANDPANTEKPAAAAPPAPAAGANDDLGV